MTTPEQTREDGGPQIAWSRPPAGGGQVGVIVGSSLDISGQVDCQIMGPEAGRPWRWLVFRDGSKVDGGWAHSKNKAKQHAVAAMLSARSRPSSTTKEG